MKRLYDLRESWSWSCLFLPRRSGEYAHLAMEGDFRTQTDTGTVGPRAITVVKHPKLCVWTHVGVDAGRSQRASKIPRQKQEQTKP